MSNLKTNNSYLSAKVNLRVNHLPDTDPLLVIDAYCGKGLIWNEVERITGRNISVLGIDKENHPNVDIVCDNLKVLAGIDLSNYHVIDLDAYGCPYAQMQILFNHGYAGRVFVTYIQSFMGNLPKGILKQAGFTQAMLSKAQTIFTKNPLAVWENYLSKNGVKKITIKSLDRKHYMVFDVQKCKGDSNG